MGMVEETATTGLVAVVGTVMVGESAASRRVVEVAVAVVGMMETAAEGA